MEKIDLMFEQSWLQEQGKRMEKDGEENIDLMFEYSWLEEQSKRMEKDGEY